MKHLVVGLFTDSKQAGDAVATLKEKGFTKDISVVAKNPDEEEVASHTIKTDGSQGTQVGATAGAVAGGATMLLAGITAVVVPGVGLVAGVLATTLAGAATGAVTGGIIGYLVDKGIPDNTAKEYSDRIEHGEILVACEVDDEDEAAVKEILNAHGVVQTQEDH